MSLKEKRIKFKSRIKLDHNIYTYVSYTLQFYRFKKDAISIKLLSLFNMR